jgi:hypothetical protein
MGIERLASLWVPVARRAVTGVTLPIGAPAPESSEERVAGSAEEAPQALYQDLAFLRAADARGLVRDVLHDRHGALPNKRDRHRMGAHVEEAAGS